MAGPDKTTLPEPIAGLPPARQAVADRGYSARSIIELFAALGTTTHIPSWDAFSQMAALTRLWLEERGVVVGFLKLPTKKQMTECAFDIMRDSVPATGHA